MEEKKYQTECGNGCKKQKIKGITCDVKNCVYHEGENDCYAGCISVGPHSATTSSATACATFKSKEC